MPLTSTSPPIPKLDLAFVLRVLTECIETDEKGLQFNTLRSEFQKRDRTRLVPVETVYEFGKALLKVAEAAERVMPDGVRGIRKHIEEELGKVLFRKAHGHARLDALFADFVKIRTAACVHGSLKFEMVGTEVIARTWPPPTTWLRKGPRTRYHAEGRERGWTRDGPVATGMEDVGGDEPTNMETDEQPKMATDQTATPNTPNGESPLSGDPWRHPELGSDPPETVLLNDEGPIGGTDGGDSEETEDDAQDEGPEDSTPERPPEGEREQHEQEVDEPGRGAPEEFPRYPGEMRPMGEDERTDDGRYVRLSWETDDEDSSGCESEDEGPPPIITGPGRDRGSLIRCCGDMAAAAILYASEQQHAVYFVTNIPPKDFEAFDESMCAYRVIRPADVIGTLPEWAWKTGDLLFMGPKTMTPAVRRRLLEMKEAGAPLYPKVSFFLCGPEAEDKRLRAELDTVV